MLMSGEVLYFGTLSTQRSRLRQTAELTESKYTEERTSQAQDVIYSLPAAVDLSSLLQACRTRRRHQQATGDS
jgi:hypothetical protein